MFIALISIKQMRAFQSLAGWQGRFDDAQIDMEALYQRLFQSQTGWHRRFDISQNKRSITGCYRFNPKRAGIVVSTSPLRHSSRLPECSFNPKRAGIVVSTGVAVVIAAPVLVFQFQT